MTVVNPGGGGSVTLSNQGLVPGWSACFCSAGGGANNPGVNLIEFTAFQVFVPSVFNQMSFQVGAQSGNVDVGIYDNTGTAGAPGTRLSHSGSTACPAAGLATIAVPLVTLQPGKYYAAIVLDNGVATIEFFSGVSYLDATKFRYNQTVFPLPATAAAAVITAGAGFVIVPSHS